MLLDRWTKRLVAARIAMYAHIQIIPGFFRLTHTENTGAAFSLFADSPSHWKTAMLIGFSVVAMVVVSVLLWKQSHAADDHRRRAFADIWAGRWEIYGIAWPAGGSWISCCFT